MNCNTTHYRANSSSVPGDPTAETEDADTISIDEPATVATTETETEVAEIGEAAVEDDADVIVLHPETPEAEAIAEAAEPVDATADERMTATMEEIAAGETETVEGAMTDMATATDTAIASDATSATAPAEMAETAEATAGSPADAERLARYERSLEDLADRFAILRSSFTDMAIAADARLEEIEELLAQIRLDR